MKKLLVILLCLQIIGSKIVSAQTFQATVNRNDVPQGETFMLTLETDDDKTSDTPDLSVLDKDFDVYSVGSAYQKIYINGATKHSRQWQIILMPKNYGRIEIPAIKLGKMSSQPIILNVTPSQLVQSPDGQSQDSLDNKQKFAVEALVDNKNPYVQQQINYTFKIYDSGGLYGEMPVINDENNDWIVKSLGNPEIKSKVINGRQLREIEFKYALFPQKSGQLKLPDFEFNGYYLTKSHRGTSAFDDIFNSGFFNMGFSDMFASRNPVVLKPKSISVNVKPIPASNGGYWWLPASQVVLTSEWEDKNPIFRVGEAVGRFVYLKAFGVIETQIPDIHFKEMEGVKQYPDKPVAMSMENNDEIISVKKFGNVFIPEKSGDMTIPEVTVDWFNIHNGQIEKATLPAQKITVLPALSGQESISTESSEKETKIVNNQEEIISQPTAETKNIPSWIWIICAFVLGLIISYVLFGRKTNGRKPSVKGYAKHVEQSLQMGDFKGLRDNLLAWAKEAYKDNQITNLDDIEKYTQNNALKEQLAQINKMLYSPKKAEFQADIFLKAFKEEQKKRKKTQKAFDPLPKLYK